MASQWTVTRPKIIVKAPVVEPEPTQPTEADAEPETVQPVEAKPEPDKKKVKR
jgi:hypothetical protein